MQIKRDLVVFDLETTGTWIEQDKIIEIAMIHLSPEGSEKSYQKFVNPNMPIPDAVVELTGISNEQAKEAPLFKDIAQEVVDFIGDADLGGFNIERFDLPVLEREFFEAGIKFVWQARNLFDAQKVYHVNEKRDLAAAYKFYCDQDLQGAHSALADTEATLKILQAQVKRYVKEDASIESLREFDYQRFDDYYDSERKFRWWNGKLYMMFGKYAKRYSLQELVNKDRGYLQWVLSANFNDDVKELVSKALDGHFPVYKKEETY